MTLRYTSYAGMIGTYCIQGINGCDQRAAAPDRTVLAERRHDRYGYARRVPEVAAPSALVPSPPSPTGRAIRSCGPNVVRASSTMITGEFE